MLTQTDLLTAAISPRDVDLQDLFSIATRRGHYGLAQRLLLTLDAAPSLGLPWCPWPGRRLPLDVAALTRLLARTPPTVGVTWLGAITEATDGAVAPLLAHLAATPSTPFQAMESPYQLALTGLALRRPDRRDLAREALGAPWQALFDRVDTLERQLRERERGPLHPELARIYLTLGEIAGSTTTEG